MLEQLHSVEESRQFAAQANTTLERDAAQRKTELSYTAPPSSGPTKFLRGTLISVDCGSPPAAVLTIASGAKNLKMRVANKDHLVLIGADAFSCSWSKQKVAVNYRDPSGGEPSVLSLEIQ
jgi:hypothetical protein